MKKNVKVFMSAFIGVVLAGILMFSASATLIEGGTSTGGAGKDYRLFAQPGVDASPKAWNETGDNKPVTVDMSKLKTNDSVATMAFGTDKGAEFIKDFHLNMNLFVPGGVNGWVGVCLRSGVPQSGTSGVILYMNGNGMKILDNNVGSLTFEDGVGIDELKLDDYNNFDVVAEGKNLTVKINDKQVFTSSKLVELKGDSFLSLSVCKTTKAEFKDIRLEVKGVTINNKQWGEYTITDGKTWNTTAPSTPPATTLSSGTSNSKPASTIGTASEAESGTEGNNSTDNSSMDEASSNSVTTTSSKGPVENKGNNITPIIIVIVVVVVLAGGGIGAYFYFTKIKGKKEQ